MADMTATNDRKIIFTIFIIGLLIRILYLADFQKTDVFPILKDSDGYSYFKWAKNILEKAVYMEPENYLIHFQLAKVYKAAGEFDKARAEFELVLNKINRWQTEEKKMVINELTQLR